MEGKKNIALEMSVDDMILKTKEEMNKMKECIRLDLFQRENAEVHEDEIMRKADQLAEELMNKEVSDTYLESEFDEVWERWKNELALREQTVDIPIHVRVEGMLFQYQNDIRVNLDQEVMNTPLNYPLGLKQLEGTISFEDNGRNHICINATIQEIWFCYTLGTLTGTNRRKRDKIEKKCRNLAVNIINQIMKRVDLYSGPQLSQQQQITHSTNQDIHSNSK